MNSRQTTDHIEELRKREAAVTTWHNVEGPEPTSVSAGDVTWSVDETPASDGGYREIAELEAEVIHWKQRYERLESQVAERCADAVDGWAPELRELIEG